MRNYLLGLVCGLVLGGLGIAGAQFYPGMPDNVRDSALNDMNMRQQMEQTQQWMFREEQQRQQRNPC